MQPKIRLIIGSALFRVGFGGLMAWVLTQGALPLPLYATLALIGLALILIEVRKSYS